jgi:hypothetical protein
VTIQWDNNNMGKINKSAIYLSFNLILCFLGCKHAAAYKSKADLTGSWNGELIEVTTPSNNYSHFSISKYGYASLILRADSTYYFAIEIFKDVIIEKNVLGNNYPKRLIKAKFKDICTGRYNPYDTYIYMNNKPLVLSDSITYYFNERTLYTKSKDKNNNVWLIPGKREICKN